MKKVDLNIWKGARVALTIKNTAVTEESENGDVISKPYVIVATFIHWDGQYIHINENTDEQNSITTSLLATHVIIIELAKEPEPLIFGQIEGKAVN